MIFLKNKKTKNRDNSAIKAFKPKFNDIKSDTDGSYTGTPEKGEKPVITQLVFESACIGAWFADNNYYCIATPDLFNL